MKKYTCIFIFFVFINFLNAHPHLFIDPVMNLIINEDKLTGIKVEWTWDEWWSMDVIDACDKNKNKVFEQNEIDLVYKDFFSAVKDFNFFTILEINNRKIPVNKTENFSAKIDKGIVKYYFTIPLDISVSDKMSVKIFKNDDTVFTAFEKIKLNINSDKYNITDLKTGVYNFCGTQASAVIVKK